MTSMIHDYFVQIQQNRNSANYKNLMTHVKPDVPIGKLIRPNIFSAKDVVNQDIKNMRYFVQGIQGKGNDYSIGKINDFAIKAGGLGIAAMIASGVTSPFKRGMEFIGLGLWLAAMKFWPKLGIAYPIKHRTGVDLNLEYTDSEGRRKLFYQDPQYICWDLISDKEINEIGDKLKIPKNIKNRRAAIENKAKQVAVQGNTLILATSGFATPIIASLASDQVANKIYAPFLNSYNQIRSKSLINNMLKTPDWLKDNIAERKIDRIFSSKINPADRQKLLEVLDLKTDDQSLKKAIYQTVDNIFSGEDIKNIYVELDENLKNKIKSAFFKNNVPQESEQKLNELFLSLNNKIEKNQFNNFLGKLEEILKSNNILTNNKKINEGLSKVQELLYLNKTVEFSSTETAKNKIKEVAKILGTYDKKITKDFNKYLKYFDASNTHLWTSKPSEIIKAFGLKSDELKTLASITSREKSNEILMKMFNNLANADEQKLSKVVKKLSKIFQKAVQTNKEQLDLALKYLENLENNFAQICKESPELAEHFSRMFENYRRIIINKYLSSVNTFATPLKTLNIFMLMKDKGFDKETLGKIALNNLNADNFINKLDNFRNFIKNDSDYKKYAELLFQDVNKKLADIIDNPDLVKSINESNRTLKTLFEGLTDNVNFRLDTKLTFQDIINRLKGTNSKILDYFDEFFEFSINDQDNIANFIKEKAKQNPDKLKKLLSILNINPDSTNLDKEILDALTGKNAAGEAYLTSGKNKMKNILSIFDIKNIKELFNNSNSELRKYLNNIDIKKVKTGKISDMEGRTFASLINMAATNTLTYKNWLKRVGLSFVALIALTSLAISKFGKKNEFNLDVYQKENK